MAEKTADMTRRGPEHMGTRREPGRIATPSTVFDRFADEMDRFFDDFGLGRNALASRGRNWSNRLFRPGAMWAPEIEVSQRNNELIIRADLPGMKKDDVSIDVTDNDITISGERRQQEETEQEGVFRSERTYGSFRRTIPLPEGALTDQAKASFRDGVLEITVPAPPQATRGRRLEIETTADAKK